MKREHLARRLTEAGAEQRRRRLETELPPSPTTPPPMHTLAAWRKLKPPPPRPPEPEPVLEPIDVELVDTPAPRRRRRPRRPPGPTRDAAAPAPNVGGRTPWYAPGAVPISVHVAHWALVERDGDATAAAAINRAAADLADELEPIGLTPEVTPYRPVSAAARERDRLL